MLVVTLPYDPEWRALAWAKEHCPSYITNDVYLQTRGTMQERRNQIGESKINYYFATDKDATLFALRWAA